MPWETSDRKAELPPDWEARRRRCRDAAGGRCQGFDSVTRKRCALPGTDADHRGDPDDHDDLQWLCGHHHMLKTQQESARARRANQAKLRHPVEVHPALRP